MKYQILFSLLLLLSISTSAQTDELKWFTNLEEAQTFSKENNTQILMVFSGSDWCKPCIQFKKDILESEKFISEMKDKVVILYLDFPARRKNKLSKEQTTHNEALAEKYNQSGLFPNIFLLDLENKIVANPKFAGHSPTTFIQEFSK